MPTARYKPEDIQKRPGVTIGKSVGESLGEAKKATKKIWLLENVFMPPATWVIGVRTDAAQNYKSKQAEFGSIHHQRIAVSRALGGDSFRYLVPFVEEMASGEPIRVIFTRLAPKSIDAFNLTRALKHVIDSLAMKLGIDDNSPLLTAEAKFFQETSTHMGVRIEMKLIR